MSDRNKNIKSKLPDFLRYNKGLMSGKERNSFERELQKDPFSEEALEGIASKSQGEASKDILLLQKLLRKRTHRKQRFMIYRIAASIAILMVISSVFIIVERNKSGKQLSESIVKSQPMTITVDKPINGPVKKEVLPEKPAGKALQSKAGYARQQSEKNTNEAVRSTEEKEKETRQTTDKISENKIEVAESNVAEEMIASPIAVTSDRKAKMSKKAESDTYVNADVDTNFSLNEVIVAGYGSKRDESLKDDSSTGYIPPKPVNGKTDFNKYIRQNLHWPDTTSSRQRVSVVVSFTVHINGSIDSVRIVRSPGKSFSDEVIRLIKSGPSWSPAEENGKLIEDEVRLKIVFSR